ncbi:MAG: alkaline phosphatase family protein [Myxococcales bacterium]|nr:alkaline phosphatase family protein [Myxococcales bacterium]
MAAGLGLPIARRRHLSWPLMALALAMAGAACRTRKPADVPPAPASASQRLPVVVTLVVDQLSAWAFEERFHRLPPAGGFHRLAREGTRIDTLRYAHAVTDTAPGHASLYTGAVPREHGIYGNELVDDRGTVGAIIADPATRLVCPGATEGTQSASAARLRVPTIADQFREAHEDALIVSLSLKDRGALLPAGKRPTAAVWLDVKEFRFVTSTAVASSLPAFVERHGSRDALARGLAVWTHDGKARGDLPDDQPGEGDESGLGRTFPHDPRKATSPGRAFRTTPASDRTLFALALDALDAERAASRPTLLALSLSAHDYVGHVFGPDSWEAWEELFALDAALAEFFRALDARFSEAGWAAVLSGDHGTMSMPEVVARRSGSCAGAAPRDRYERPCGVTHRIDPDALTARLRASLETALPGKGALLRGVGDPYVFVSPEVSTLGPPDRERFDQTVRRTLLSTGGVRAVFAVDALPKACPPQDGDDALDEEARIAALVCRSVLPNSGEHAGAYYVIPTRGSFFDPRIVRGFGTSHGSPYLYDRTVPMLVRAPGRAAAGLVVREPVDFRAFAMTASRLLGVSPPAAAKGGRDFAR